MLSLIALLRLGALGALRGSGAAFSPLALFANGEEGAWYDPSDLSTLFQDAAGTTPVTAADDPVRLMLDKSQGLALGNELMPNGTFDSSTTGWDATSGAVLSVQDGAMVITCLDGDTISSARERLTVEANSAYELRWDITGFSGQGWQILVGTYSVTNLYYSVGITAATGSYRIFILTGASTELQIEFYCRSEGSGDQVVTVDNVSLRRLHGNHALAPSDAARPLLKQTAGGLRYLQFDGVDDAFDLPAFGTVANFATFTIAKAYAPNAKPWILLSDKAANIPWAGIGVSGSTSTILTDQCGQNSIYFDGESSSALTRAQQYTLSQNANVVRGEYRNLITDQLDRIGIYSGGGGITTIGDLYGVLIINRALTESEELDCDTYLAQKVGVTLS